MTKWVRGVRRHRCAVTLTAAALIGAPLIAGSAASADSADSVTFTGGCQLLGLGEEPRPDADRVSVPAGDGLRFVNELDKPATLVLDDEAVTRVPHGGSADVVFHDGPVRATMQIGCLLDDPSADAVVVDVEPADAEPAATSSGDGSASSANDRTGSSGAGGGDNSSSAGGNGSADSADSAASPSEGPGQRRADSGDASDHRWAAAPPAGTAPGGGVPGGWSDGSGGPAGSDGAPAEGSPDAAPGDHEADEADRDRGSRWEFEDHAGSGETSLDPANVDSQADDRPATEQVSQTAGSDDESVGLLALVATVCVVGVSAGAIRVLVGRRATSVQRV